MGRILAIALGLFSWGSVAAWAHQIDQTTPPTQWNLYVEGDQAKLAYGAPNSDLVGVMLTCNRGDGAVVVSGDVSPDKPMLVLTSGERKLQLSGPAETDPFGGGLYMEARASTHDAALERFARTGDLALQRGFGRTEMRATAHAKGDIEKFFAHCEA
ncbi:MAG: hypothetical protein K1X35_13885 [Caulobacteraceae bacterium]|nr:hypothetical protein [Caulobacteraceae bacterium]